MKGALYESNNADSGCLPPFNDYVFYVVDVWDTRMSFAGYPSARVLILNGDRMFPPGTMHDINSAYWIWSGARRIV